MADDREVVKGKTRFERAAGFAPTGGDLVALGIGLMSLALFFWPVIFGDKVFFFRDVCLEIVPKRGFMDASHFYTLWNPYSFFGMPAAANSQWSSFYPLNLLFLAGSIPRAVSFYIMFHYVLALFSTYLLIRSMGMGAAGALGGALAFSWGGFFMSLGNMVVMLNSSAWIMFLLWALWRAMETGDFRFKVLAGVFWAMQVLGGEAEIAFLSGLVLLVFYIGCASGARGAMDVAKKFVAITVIASIAALCLSAVQWLISAELTMLSNRASGFTFKAAASWSLHLSDLWSLIVPRKILAHEGETYRVLDLHGRELPYLLSIYPGVSVLAAALFAAGKNRRRWTAFAIGGFVFLVLALGKEGGLYWVFYELIPGFNRFRIPEKCVYGFAVFIALLAGAGIESLSGLGAKMLRRPGLTAPLGFAACLIVLADLFAAHGSLNPVVSPGFYDLAGAVSERIPEGIRDERGMLLEPNDRSFDELKSGDEAVSFYRHRRLLLKPFVILEKRIHDIESRSSIYPADVDLWNGLYDNSTPGLREKLMTLSGVEWVVVPDGSSGLVEHSLPRAYFVPEARFFPDRESVLGRMKDPEFDPTQTVLLEGATPSSPSSGAGEGFMPLSLSEKTNERIEIILPRTGPGWIILLDSFYPGWKVTINGKAAPLYRANGFFRAAPVDGEGGKAEFIYRPWTFLAGVAISLVSLLACLWVLASRKLISP